MLKTHFLRKRPPLRWHALFAWIALATPALADEFDVAWQAPEECPSKQEVERRLLDLRAENTGQPALEIDGRIEKVAGLGGYRLKLRTKLNRRLGEREVAGSTCEEVTAAGVAVLALLIDAEAERKEQPAAPKPEPAPAVSLPAVPPPAAPSTPTRRQSSGLQGPSYFVTSGVGAGVGILPGLGVAFEARVGVRLRFWNIQGTGRLWPSRTAYAGALETAGATISLTSAGILACREVSAGSTFWRGCGGMEVDRLVARAFGVPNSRSVPEVSPTLVGGIGFSTRVGLGVAVSCNLEATAPLRRPRFVLDNIGPVFARSALGGRTSLGLELAF